MKTFDSIQFNKKIYVVLFHYKDIDNNSKIATFVEGVFSSKKLANKVGLTLVSNHLAKDAKDKVKGLQFLYYDVVKKRLDLSIHLL